MIEDERERAIIEENIKAAKKEIYERVLEKKEERTVEEVHKLIGEVRDKLREEKEKGRGKLSNTISKIREGEYGIERFVDENIVYIPDKGEAIFVGDIHGDLDSLVDIIEQNNFIEEMERGSKDLRLFFLGDLTNRGKESERTLELVMSLKKRYSENVELVRGNHEDFFMALNKKLGEWLYKSITDKFGSGNSKLLLKYNHLFRELPGVVVTGNGIVATHGGIPNEDIRSLKDLNNKDRLKEMRWSDPNDEDNYSGRMQTYSRKKKEAWDGEFCPMTFGSDVFKDFMDAIRASVMIRSHQDIPEGFETMFCDKLVTIFSTGGNRGSSAYIFDVEKPKFARVSLEEPKEEWSASDFQDIKQSWLPY